MVQKVRGSKRKKKVARKIDVEDIEDAAAKKLEEEIHGGPIEQRKDELIFFKDTNKASKKTDQWKNKVLSYEKVLLDDPRIVAAKPPLKHPAKSKEVKLNKKQAQNLLSNNEKLKPASPSSETRSDTYDLWGSTSSEGSNEWLEPTLKNPPKPPKRQPVPTFKLDIHPGSSYNPSYDDHQDLLGKALAEELRSNPRRSKRIEAQKIEEKEKGVEVDEGEQKADEREKEEEEEETVEKEYVHVNKPNTEKKSKTQRNKEKRKREHEKELEERRRLKKQKQDIDRANQIVKEIKRQEVIKAEHKMAKELLKDRERVPKLGRHKFREMKTTYLVTEELPDNLRTIPPVNPVTEHYKSIQRRGLMEVTKRKKKKQKAVPKKSVKKFKFFTPKSSREDNWV